METDPLSPSASLNSLENPPAILDPVTNVNHEAPDISTDKSMKFFSKHESADSSTSHSLSDFICFVCNNTFDDMAKLHLHMSMKHKGIKVCGILCQNRIQVAEQADCWLKTVPIKEH